MNLEMLPTRPDRRFFVFLGCALAILWSSYSVISARGVSLEGSKSPLIYYWPWHGDLNVDDKNNDDTVAAHKPTGSWEGPSAEATSNSATTAEFLLPTSTQDAVVEETRMSVALYEYDAAPLKALCAKRSWVSSADVVLQCEGRVGGVGNTKQEILWCMRFAIEAGASLIRPTIMLRSENIIDYQSGPITNLSYVFDFDLFESRIKEACPLLVIYDSLADVEKRGPIKRINPDRWILPWDTSKQEVIRPLNDFITANRAGVGETSLVVLGFAQFQTEICFDGPQVVDHFGGLLSFRQEAHIIATKILHELSTRFNIPKAPQFGVATGAYIGIHLRTEVDAVAAGFTSYEDQRDMYLQMISSRTPAITVVYASSGNLTSVADFAHSAAALPDPVSVVTKRDLLSEADTEVLNKMTWDQQALVDFLVLTKSSYFGGVGHSSFSYGVAYARHAISKEGSCVETRADLPTDVWFQDELSMIFGGAEWKGIYLGKTWP